MAAYRLKGRHAFDGTLLGPVRVAVLVHEKDETKEIVFKGREPVDFGRKKAPEEIVSHPWLEEVVEEAAEKKRTSSSKAKKTEDASS